MTATSPDTVPLLRSRRFWHPVSLVACGVAVGLVFAASTVLLTRVHLEKGYDCGYVVELAVDPAHDPGGEIPEEDYLRATKGCDTAAAPIVRSADILIWTGFGVVLIAAGSVIICRRSRW